jgi:hypothetical protein
MNIRIAQNAGSFFIVSGTTSLLLKTVLHKVRFGSTILAVYWKGLVYLFIHSVTYVTMDTSITDYNLQHIF